MQQNGATMNRTGTGPQPLRGIPGNVFQTQQTAPPRTGSFGSGRLQNGRLTGTNTWGTGIAGAPSFQNAQSRTSTNLSNYAQKIGGSQTQASLDLSEFPSLGGTQQPQQQASSAAIWANAGVRTSQNAPVQRSQGNSSQSGQPQLPTAQPQQHHQGELSGEQTSSQFQQLGAGLDDYRLGHAVGSHISRASEQHGQTDDFPPLGGLGGAEVDQSRRQEAGSGMRFNGAGNGNPFSRAMPTQSRSRLLGQFDHRQDVPHPRSPLDSMPHDQDMNQRLAVGGRISQNTGGSGYPPPQQQAYSPSHQPDVEEGVDRGSFEQSTGTHQDDAERWGLQGLLSTIRGQHGEDQASLALGMDLNSLGLDLNRPDSEYLYKDWAGPFADAQARPPIPDFHLPQAYTVQNVPPLQSKIGSFSDDTLFVIFYQNPRDEAQEMAAAELYSRDWRWHKKLQQWMMKAKEFGEPIISPSKAEERGYYYFWNAQEWRRERREFILSYEHLHHSPNPLQTMPSL